MTVEHTIPVYLGGPCHGQPLPPDPALRLPVMLELPSRAPVFAGTWPHEEQEQEPARYVRRTYKVGNIAAHAWMHGDFAGGLRDTEAAELMWRWLLEAAGVTS